VPARSGTAALLPQERLRQFDQANQRQQVRERAQAFAPATRRGWTREELYTRGRTR
jgi:hypothetical protein